MSVGGMLGTARHELGYIEGTNNATKFGKAYGVDHESWCAMFLWWCGKQSNEETAVGKYAYCPYWVTHWKKLNQWASSRYELERGHIIFWDWNHNGDANHVEIVESVKVDKHGMPTSVVTIGGNTGANSDRVARNARNFEYFLGAGKPHYSDYKTAWVGKLLLKGSHSSAVKRMQEKLIAHKYNVGGTKNDGSFGTHTQTAVVQFQRDHKLTADGIVGPLTWKKLFAT